MEEDELSSGANLAQVLLISFAFLSFKKTMPQKKRAGRRERCAKKHLLDLIQGATAVVEDTATANASAMTLLAATMERQKQLETSRHEKKWREAKGGRTAAEKEDKDRREKKPKGFHDPLSSKRHLSAAPQGRQAQDDGDRPAKAKKTEAEPRAAHQSMRK